MNKDQLSTFVAGLVDNRLAENAERLAMLERAIDALEQRVATVERESLSDAA